MTSNGAEPLRNPATAADLDVTYPRGNKREIVVEQDARHAPERFEGLDVSG